MDIDKFTSHVFNDDIASVREMLIRGIDPNAMDDLQNVPIWYAKNVQMVQLLVEYGANINGMTKIQHDIRHTLLSKLISESSIPDLSIKHVYFTSHTMKFIDYILNHLNADPNIYCCDNTCLSIVLSHIDDLIDYRLHEEKYRQYFMSIYVKLIDMLVAKGGKFSNISILSKIYTHIPIDTLTKLTSMLGTVPSDIFKYQMERGKSKLPQQQKYRFRRDVVFLPQSY